MIVIPIFEVKEMKADVAIVGAGPAGMSAALTAEKAGAEVILLDESFSLGGQLRQDTKWYTSLPNKYDEQYGVTLNEQLIHQLNQTNVTSLTTHTLIGSYLNGHMAVTNGERTIEIEAKKIILAPGAQEEAKIFPGWTLPGVMTASAAQSLINRERILPGKKAIMLGLNDFSIEIAKQLEACGVSIFAFVDDKDSNSIKFSHEEIEGLQHVPVYLNSTLESVTGRNGVEKVIISTPHQIEEVNADLVCISNGFSPILEPFEILGCDFTYNQELGGFMPKYNSHLQTSNSLCYVAGNAAGITSLGPTLLTGEIAAISVLEVLTFINAEEAKQKREELWEEVSQIESCFNENIVNARLTLMENTVEEIG